MNTESIFNSKGYMKTDPPKMDFYKKVNPIEGQHGFDFDGSNYEEKYDKERLTGQILRVYECMKDGMWRTMDEISTITGDPQASISAQLRHLRKERFGSHIVDKRTRGDRYKGLWEYKLSIDIIV